MNCSQCGNTMVNAFTTFTAVVEDEVYVVEGVPCLECSVCEHISFEQNVAKKLERYTSGRVLPAKMQQAWVFRWNAPVVEIGRDSRTVALENTPVQLFVTGTKNV